MGRIRKENGRENVINEDLMCDVRHTENNFQVTFDLLFLPLHADWADFAQEHDGTKSASSEE